MPRMWVLAVGALMLARPALADPGWPAYGGDEGGQRYSAAGEITPANVTRLRKAWTYSTGDMQTHAEAEKQAAFEDTPILADGRLYVCSPFNEVSAVDPGTGREIWRFDPHIDTGDDVDYPNGFTCRGVTYWKNPRQKSGPCAERIFAATNDRRLIALDAATGVPCPKFGDRGTIRIESVPAPVRKGEAQTTSAPVVGRGVVVVGSSLDDNQRVREIHGVVHAYDAVTGAPKWSFDPIPRSPSAPNAASWSGAGAAITGGANAWAPMSVDEQRGLVFVPTTSPSPDFFGGLRPGDNRYADSVVALNLETGQVAWAFQVTHHDVWDYDIPAQPTLATVTYKGRTRPAVIQTTKQGLLFTLDRETGQPLIPVEERAVPQNGAPGEQLWPTQPFPVAPKPLAPIRARPDDAYGITFWDRGACRAKIAAARAGWIYTPPSTQGTILYPFTGGGSNWGGLAFDQRRDVVYVNTSSAMHLVTLIPRKDFAAVKAANPHKEVSPQAGAPYGMKREIVVSPLGMPCNPPPWGMLHAIDMHDGHVIWEVPLGTTEDLAPFTEYVLGKTGTPNFGGPIATAGGLVFIGAAMDNYLRAFDAKTGKELWRGRLPGGGQATPMTYVWKGRQYVVIAAGGHYKSGTKRNDKVVAFAPGP
ncbi:MAG TPA: pyrroloquinoline quinone-dependent dehydrogenase [Rhizomicrobium sp.]|nr:pyrroloquinoline quinone-dependent dehydrogenase [Rhizomicrobium sp.]